MPAAEAFISQTVAIECPPPGASRWWAMPSELGRPGIAPGQLNAALRGAFG